MYSSNAIVIIMSFSKEEFKEFGKFVRSPFFNTHKDIIRYYIFLKKFYPDFEKSSFTKHKIFSHVYPGRIFNNNEFLKLNSRLHQLALQFFKYIPNKFLDEYKILTELVDRNLGKQFHTYYKNLNYFIDEQEELDNLIFIKKIYAKSANIRYLMNKDRQKDVCGDIINRGDYFAYQSLMWIMIQLRDMSTNFNAYNYPYESSNSYKFISAVDLEKLIMNINFENNRLGRFLKYYLFCLLIMLHPDNENYFDQFKVSFQKIFKQVNRLEKNNYVARMQSFVMKHAQKGNTKYINELLNTYKLFFSKEDVFENEIIPLPPFRNAVTLSVFVKDFVFLNELINIYSQRLYPDYRDDSVKLARAHLFFTEKNFDKVFETLRSFRYKHPPHKIDVKMLLLKAYFENNDFDYLITFIDSFRHLVSNNKLLSELHRKQFNNCISITNQIAALKLKDNINELSNLKTEIGNNKYELIIFDRIWLTEKIDEILNGKNFYI